MKNSDKSKKDLIKELAELRQQISEMEASKIECMKVEEELRSNEEKWRLLYENLPGGSFVINSQYLIQDVNDVLCKTTGYKREELIGQLCDIICPKGPHKCPIFDNDKDRIDNDKTAVKTKDGRLVPILKSARRIPLQEEELVVENFQDISETVRIEKELKESEGLLRNILAASPVGIAYAKERIVVWANESMAKMFGFEDEKEYLGKSTHHLYVSDEEYQRVGKIIYEGMMTGDIIETDTKFRRTDGSIFDGHVRVSIIDPSDPIKGIIVNILDITQRKKIEEELIRLSSAIKISNDSVVITDRSGKIIDANESTLRICKIDDKNDLIGKTPLDLTPPEERKMTIGTMKEILKKGYIQNREFNIFTKEGDKIPIEMSVSLMKDKDGEPIGFVAISRDITERKQAEKNLRFLSSITEQVTDSIIVTDTDFIISYINRACEELYGYSKDEIIGKTPDILNAELIADEIQKNIYQTVSSEKIWEGNLLNIRKDGRVFFAELKISPLYDGNGHIISYIGIQRDITKRIATEEALQESEAKFRNLFESSKDVVYLSSINGRFVDINPSGEELFGYTKNELLAIDVRDLYKNPEERIIFQREIERSGYVKDYEVTFRRKDGTYINCLLTSTVRKDEHGNILGYQGIIDDITERIKAEEALKYSEERFKDIAENAMEWIWEVDKNGKYVYSSRVVEKILGYKQEEVLEKHFYDFFHPEDRKELKNAALEVFDKKLPFKGFINKNTHKNGKTVWLSTSGVPIIDNEGNFIGYIGADTDITERKKSEELLRESEKKYRELVENIDDIIYVLDSEGKFKFINKTLEKALGYSIDEILNRNFRDIQKNAHWRRCWSVRNRIL